jgi:hypothetical protein
VYRTIRFRFGCGSYSITQAYTYPFSANRGWNAMLQSRRSTFRLGSRGFFPLVSRNGFASAAASSTDPTE